MANRRKALAWDDSLAFPQILGFTSQNEMSDFMTDPRGRFFKYFELYAQRWILPAQQKVAPGQVRKRGPGCQAVEVRMLAGERGGNDKYSQDDPDMSEWDQTDYLAWVLLKVRTANLRSKSGIFYGKGLSDMEINDRVWGLLKLAESRMSPARLVKEPVGRLPSSPSPVASHLARVASKQASPSRQLFSRAGTPANPDVIETRPQDGQGELQPKFTRAELEAQFQGEVLAFKEPGGIIPDIMKDGANESLGFSRTMSNAQRMLHERNSVTFDIADRFWVCWLVDKVLDKHLSVEELDHEIEFVEDLVRISDVENSDWAQRQIADMENDKIIYELFTPEAAEAFDAQQAWLDNEDYQREDLEGACKLLGIPWNGDRTVYRMEGMALGTSMTYWQAVGLAGMIEFYNTGETRGCLLADTMGLGKIIMLICFFLWHSKQRQSHELGALPPRPYLFVVPKRIVNQVIREFEKFVPGYFKLFKYHGDGRRVNKKVGDETIINGIMTRKHDVFRGEKAARRIVVTSHSTFAARHGPSAQRTWRINHSRMTTEDIDKKYLRLDQEWEHNLSGCFEAGAIDEIHLVKNIKSQGSTAFNWLNLSWVNGASGSLLPQGSSDFVVYLKFLESPRVSEWFKSASLTAMRQDTNSLNVNFYDVDDNSPVVKLRVTELSAKRWIFSNRVFQVDQGLRMRQLFKKCMIRRIHASRIPFVTGSRIGDQLPRVDARWLHCPLDFTELEEYKKQETALLQRLVVRKGVTIKARFSLRTYRKLSMLAVWVILSKVDDHTNLTVKNLKALMTDKHDSEAFHYAVLSDSFDRSLSLMQRQVALKRFFVGAPKTRALLKNLRSSVVRDKEKQVIFTKISANAAYLSHVLWLAGIRHLIILSHHSDEERDDLVRRFDEDAGDNWVLIMIYAVGSVGFNCQHLCWRVHIFEQSWLIGDILQVIGRVRRYGNSFDVVYVVEYHLSDDINNREVFRILHKAISETMANLNRFLFQSFGDEGDNLDDFDLGDIGDWVMENGELIFFQESIIASESLSMEDLIMEVLVQSKGTYMQVS